MLKADVYMWPYTCIKCPRKNKSVSKMVHSYISFTDMILGYHDITTSVCKYCCLNGVAQYRPTYRSAFLTQQQGILRLSFKVHLLRFSLKVLSRTNISRRIRINILSSANCRYVGCYTAVDVTFCSSYNLCICA